MIIEPESSSAMNPDISIISACYNQGKFIKEMLASILAQTFQNFEVIIVNDGSTDNTAEILKSISSQKVKIITTNNHGPAHARNTAIKYAKASIILNLDADDKIGPDLLEKAFIIFTNDPNAGIVYSDVEFFGARAGKFKIGLFTIEGMLFDNKISSIAFFRKDDWDYVGGYSEELIYGLEDWDLWLSIIELKRNVIKIQLTRVYYRIHSSLNLSRSGRRKLDRMNAIKSLALIFKRHEKLYSNYPNAWKKFSKYEKIVNENFFFIKCIKNRLFILRQEFNFKYRLS